MSALGVSCCPYGHGKAGLLCGGVLGWGERGGGELGVVVCGVRTLDVCKHGNGGDMQKGESRTAATETSWRGLRCLWSALLCGGAVAVACPQYP